MRILTFDIGGTEIKYALCDENYKLTDKKAIPTNAHRGSKSIISEVAEIIKGYGGIDRVGISTAGQVDYEKGVIVYATDSIPGYTGVRVKEIIESETGVPTAVENDVNSAAIGESIFGAARGSSDFICLTYGTGIGGAMFINGGLYKGSGCSAGEFGHMVTHAGGAKCTCGESGCYEAYASAGALSRAVFSAVGKEMSGREIFAKESFENPVIRRVIDAWIDEIVFGLKNIVYVFNPKLIVMGGGIMNEDYIVNQVQQRLKSGIMASFRGVEVVKAQMGNDAAKLGAAYLAAQIK